MHKIYFVIFAIVLVVLILRVDWREKFSKVTHSKPAKALGQIWSEPQSTAPDSLPGLAPETAALDNLDPFAPETGQDWGDLPPMPNGNPSATGQDQAARPAPAAASPSGDPFPETLLPAPRSFQDMPEQPYLNESRQLLQQTLRNYNRISPAEREARNPKRQPQP
ncbi:MAG: hypothetical protein ONB44_24545 [candidate division KSB1 bacterium]|nr:hypothetical protein [candidate division KSB1 bacterium]MDZ7314401.1 hypothetical protein [candidate division KSB1 bacterium]